MPTAAKLVAGLCLAVLGYMVSEIIKTLLPESTDFGAFSYVSAIVGLLCGWLIVGARAGRGFSAAISNGFTGVVALVFWGLFVQAVNEMTSQAFKRQYDSMVEAIVAIFEILIEFAAVMFDINVITTLLVGAVVTGVLSEIAAKRWR